MRAWESKDNHAALRLRGLLVATLGLTLAPGLWAQRSNLKPPWNTYSPRGMCNSGSKTLRCSRSGSALQ